VAQEKKKTPASAIFAATLFVAIVIAGVVGWTASPGFRARYYAGRIGEAGNNGELAKKVIALGTDIALPAALDMLKSTDYITRYYSLVIMNQLEDKDKVRGVVDDILAAMRNETHVRNRSWACAVVVDLYISSPQDCDKMIPFLKDSAEEVRSVAVGSVQKVLRKDLPGRTPQFWLDECEKVLNKHSGAAASGHGDDTGQRRDKKQ